jgi:glycosyltransferase involved in cell wall biosynthesis
MKLLIIIPAYNEAPVLGRVIQGVIKRLPHAEILVVDDGSVDATAEVAQLAGAEVVRHPLNRGLGGAIGTGLLFAKRNNYDACITFDADGQHIADDLLIMEQMLAAEPVDVVIGSRFLRNNTIPFDRVVLNAGANLLTWLLFGVYSSDSQSGFRGFSRKAIRAIRIKTQRMEASSELFGEIARLNLHYQEIPIRVRYTKYSRLKGQKNSNAWPIFSKLVLRLFR